MKKIIVVTGLNGQLGSIIMPTICNKYDEVIFIGRNKPKYDNHKIKYIKFNLMDINNYHKLINKISSITKYIDTILISHIIYNKKDLMNIKYNEILEEFNLNIFSYFFLFREIYMHFWNKDDIYNKKAVFISAGVGKGCTDKKYLHTYSLEKNTINILLNYMQSQYIESKRVTIKILYPGSLSDLKEKESIKKDINIEI